MTDQYAVLGNPVAHSKSPLIHAAFAQQTRQDIHYEKIEVPIEGFAESVHKLISQGYKGVNVTVPFKFEAFQLANQHDASTMLAEASNTLLFNDDGIVAYNTDGVGLVTDIEINLKRAIHNSRVLMLGAGGAAQGVAASIAEKQPALFVVANRTLDKVLALQEKMHASEAASRSSMTAASFDDLDSQVFDIVINATSTGLNNVALPIPNSVFEEGGLAYDMMYGVETPFMTQAKMNGAIVADGLGMLVEQAAAAFHLWRGIKPSDTQAVIKQMRV